MPDNDLRDSVEEEDARAEKLKRAITYIERKRGREIEEKERAFFSKLVFGPKWDHFCAKYERELTGYGPNCPNCGMERPQA